MSGGIGARVAVATGAGTGIEVGVDVEEGGDNCIGTWCLQAGIEAGGESDG